MQSDTTASPASPVIAVDIRRFPWIRRFASDYAFAFDRVARFFAGNPADPRAWSDAIARRQAHTAHSTDIARVVMAQQERRGAPRAAREAAASLANRHTVVVITGQQAGLFGGPLFTLLKAMTAIRLAEKVSREHGVVAVPVFWIDAEDHDWPEVSGCTVLDHESVPRTVRLADPPGAGHLPVGRVQLDGNIKAAIDALQATLPENEFTASVLEDVRAAYRQGVSMAEAFGRWLEMVLGPSGLVVFDSSDPAAKPLASRVFTHELDHPGETAALASAAGRDLVAAGYHAQATPHERTVSLFYLDGGRDSIRLAEGTTTIGDRQMPLAALRDEAARNPDHFSPNVLLRPIVQDTLFPTICYVAGPNELAYLGQLREVYGHFDLPMPLMYQRATATIADSATVRFLGKYDLPVEALQQRDEAALNQLLQDQLPPTVEQSLTNVASEIEQRMAALAAAVPQIDPTLEGTVKSTLGRMQHDLHTLHNKVIQAAKRRDDTLRRQFHRAQALVFPNGHPQEREIGCVWFCNRYGPALVERLKEELPLEMGHHWILTL